MNERRDTFTMAEIIEIKRLIIEKNQAAPVKQKGIREKIRKIGFYYSDFSTRKGGYTLSDFELLINSGKIKNIENHKQTGKPKISKIADRPKLFDNIESVNKYALSLSSRIKKFTKNKFDPRIDDALKIANSPGNYILCVRTNSKLPNISVNPVFSTFEGLRVLYTGIASVSLRSRDYQSHFKSNNAGRSILRMSLGVMFGYKQIPRDKDPNSGKTKFNLSDEQKLTHWMCNNLIMFFFPNSDFNNIELKLINHFNPPLNLRDNKGAVNSDFRRLLSKLRAMK